VLGSLLGGVADSGFEAHLAAPDAGAAALLTREQRHPLPRFALPASRLELLSALGALLGLNRAVLRTLRELKPDVIHVNSIIGLHFATVPALLARVPLVYHEHGLPSLRGRSLWNVAFPVLVRRATRVIAIARAVREELATLGVSRDRIAVVHNGIDATVPRAASSASVPPGLAAGAFVALMIANLHPWKQHDVAIRAIAKLRDKGKHARLLILGGPSVPEYARELSALVAALGVGDRVEFAGYRADAQALLPLASCLVVASVREPFGMVLLEAMRAGVPVVAADAGGVPEIVEHEVNGLLFAPGAVAELARSLERLMEDPTLRDRLAAGGARVLRERFSIERQRQQAFAVLREAASASTRAET
jgi:glycosyltransferase involved in cell wall biosynthesis